MVIRLAGYDRHLVELNRRPIHPFVVLIGHSKQYLAQRNGWRRRFFHTGLNVISDDQKVLASPGQRNILYLNLIASAKTNGDTYRQDTEVAKLNVTGFVIAFNTSTVSLLDRNRRLGSLSGRGLHPHRQRAKVLRKQSSGG